MGAIDKLLDFIAVIVAESYLVYSGQKPVNLASTVPPAMLGMLIMLVLFGVSYRRYIATVRFTTRYQTMDDLLGRMTLISPAYNQPTSCMPWAVVLGLVFGAVAGAALSLVFLF